MSVILRICGPAWSNITVATILWSTLLGGVGRGNDCQGAGVLDPSFGNGGKVFTDFNTGSGKDNVGVGIQADGRIVVVGSIYSEVSSDDFVVTRYNFDGSLDTTFGSGGRVIVDFASLSDLATDVAIQTDGKILVVGTAVTPGVNSALVRLHSDGSLDTSFGSGGKVLLSRSSDPQVAIQVDGKIVVVVMRFPNRWGLARYLSDGSLDSSFGTDGLVTTLFPPFGGFVTTLALQEDGKIVVGGSVSLGAYPLTDWGLLRYNGDGSLDASFGNGGTVTTDFYGVADNLSAITIQNDGKIVAVGTAGTGVDDACCITHAAVARYDIDGSLDPNFGSAGKKALLYTHAYWVGGVAVEADGQIVSASGTLLRFNSNSSLDPLFFNPPLSTFSPSWRDVALQPDGKIVVVGETETDSGWVVALSRYEGATPIDRLTAGVIALVTSGSLTPVQANGLLAKLGEANKAIERGNYKPASNKLKDIADQLQAHVNSGKLSPGEAQPLIDEAECAITLLVGSPTKGSVPVEEPSRPGAALSQNWPNPFNPSTTIRLRLPAATAYDLSIYDAAGRLVRRYEGRGGPGQVAFVWDGRDTGGVPQPAGVYFYKAQAGEFVESRKMLLVK